MVTVEVVNLFGRDRNGDGDYTKRKKICLAEAFVAICVLQSLFVMVMIFIINLLCYVYIANNITNFTPQNVMH